MFRQRLLLLLRHTFERKAIYEGPVIVNSFFIVHDVFIIELFLLHNFLLLYLYDATTLRTLLLIFIHELSNVLILLLLFSIS